MTRKLRIAECRRDLLNLVLRAFETGGGTKYHQALLDDIRFFIGPDDYPAIGVLGSSVIEFSAETKAELDGPSWAHGTREANPHWPYEGPAQGWVEA